MSKEEIRKAAIEYAYDAYGEEEPECVIESIADDFEAGVKWIMSKNSWHKYPQTKPPVDNEYIVYLESPDCCPLIDIYEYSKDNGGFGCILANKLGPVEWQSVDSCVTAWMEKPIDPKFD